MQREPPPLLYDLMDECISQKSQQGKTGPHRGVASDEDGLDTQAASVGLEEQQQPGERRRQHHGHRHGLPTHKENQERHDPGPVTGSEEIVVADQQGLTVF